MVIHLEDDGASQKAHLSITTETNQGLNNSSFCCIISFCNVHYTGQTEEAHVKICYKPMEMMLLGG